MAEKKDVTVSMSDPSSRAAIEAQRGIKRNDKGEIVLSAAQKKARKAFLTTKIADFKTRIKNAEAIIASL